VGGTHQAILQNQREEAEGILSLEGPFREEDVN
jgi:hypothetical protein